MNRTIYALCLLVMVVALAGCGGGDDSTTEGAYGGSGGDETSASSSDDEGSGKATRVFRADAGGYEEILFDEGGYALYRFSKDKGSKSTCYGACAKKWPPLLTEGQPVAFAVIPSKLGMTERKDGTTQATYFGYPLYTFVGDKVEGEVSGNGVKAFGGTWHSLHRDGKDLKG